jgi:predicted nucleic acid-binding protein
VIVVDTTVLVDLFRGTDTPQVTVLEEIERDGVPFMIPDVCCQETLQGARNEKEWSLLLEYLETQQVLVPEDSLSCHIEAARIFYDCRRKGITVRSTIDCLISQMVLDGDHVLLHDDSDYDRISKVRPLRTHSPRS